MVDKKDILVILGTAHLESTLLILSLLLVSVLLTEGLGSMLTAERGWLL